MLITRKQENMPDAFRSNAKPAGANRRRLAEQTDASFSLPFPVTEIPGQPAGNPLPAPHFLWFQDVNGDDAWSPLDAQKL